MKDNALIKLLKHLTLNKGKIIFAAICSIFNKICDIVPEILIGISIDVIVNQENSIMAKLIVNPFYQLYLLGFITAILWILESIFEYFYSITWYDIAQNVQHKLRLKTYAVIQNQDFSYFENKTTGGLLTIVQDDVNQLEQFLSKGPNEVIQLVVNVIVMGSIFLYLSPVLAFITLTPIPFVIGIAYYFQNKLGYLYSIVRQISENLTSHIAYRLQGVATIKSYTTEAYEFEKLHKESSVYKKATHKANQVNAQYIPILRMAIMFGFIASLVIGGIYALQSKIPINWYAALVFLTQRFLWPFTSVTTITDMYEKSLACAKRILWVLESAPKIHDNPQSLDINIEKGKIQFDNVSFTYANGLSIFDKFNCTIPAGKTVAFVGTTGSGKSTIIKLLLRFYDPNSGKILIDNYNIKNIKLTDLRKSISFVSQDAYLVDGTIADNIAYGSFAANKQEIIEAAKMAKAHDFIMSLPHDYETMVQEHGKNLSGGQRQRISIARAIIKKSPILVFDEATSAVDNETEAAIRKSITKLAVNHTIIIIAHRLTTVVDADTIFVLEKGVIVESGNHEELLKKSGIYAKLFLGSGI